MARKLIDQLFVSAKPPPSSRVLVSFQSWKALVSRLNQVEQQVKKCQKTTENLNNLITKWLKEDKKRIQDRENALSAILNPPDLKSPLSAINNSPGPKINY